MVESLGYRIRRLFVAVFVVGSAFAGFRRRDGGLYQQRRWCRMGGRSKKACLPVCHHHRRPGQHRRGAVLIWWASWRTTDTWR